MSLDWLRDCTLCIELLTFTDSQDTHQHRKELLSSSVPSADELWKTVQVLNCCCQSVDISVTVGAHSAISPVGPPWLLYVVWPRGRVQDVAGAPGLPAPMLAQF